MPSPTTTGINTETPNRILFDAGALYRDRGQPSEEKIGATRGGATFTVEREMREVELDGIRGPIKLLRRVTREAARLEGTLVELSFQTWLDLTRGTAVSDGSVFTVTPDLNIVASDYYTNIALVAEQSGDQGGTPIELILLNALVGVGEWSLTSGDKDEGQLSFRAEAHFSDLSSTTPPYQIKVPIVMS